MTTLIKEKFKCALCRKRFKDYELTSTNTFGGYDSELRGHSVGWEPISYWIHTCPSCGFTDTNHKEKLTKDRKKRIKNFLNSYCTNKKPKYFTSSQKYEILANIFILDGMPLLRIADTYLRAGWMADDEGDCESSTDFREKAIIFFEKEYKENRSLRKEGLNIVYLLGELNRRIGKFEKASQWFSKWFEDVTEEYQRLEKLYKKQKEYVLNKESDSKLIKNIL